MNAAPGPGARSRRRGRKPDYPGVGPQGDDGSVGMPLAGGGGGAGQKGASKDQVHHHPPKDMAADVGYPVRGGQTLLIAYFPWEASEADIEQEFSKFCHVKRVHLVVDKSSRKPRCFGFVKFMSKADTEEALRATSQGLVQLPDTRGHVWHLKAEWTKSGDMVVDDSETEQEVARRKEERRHRTEGRGGPGGPGAEAASAAAAAAAQGAVPGKGSKGALHPGVPPPLPPLQPRGYPPVQGGSPLGLQGQMPIMNNAHSQMHPGLAQHAAPLGHQGHQQFVQHQSQHPAVAHQALYGSVAQPGLPMYNGQQLPPPYGGHGAAPPLYGGLPRDTHDAPGLGAAGTTLPSYAGTQPAYGQQPQYPPPQSYGAAQQSYAASQSYAATSQQAYAAGQYAASQQSYGAGQPGYAGQSYPPLPQGYPPQPHASYLSQQQSSQAPPPQQSYGSSPPPGYPPAGAGAYPSQQPPVYSTAQQHAYQGYGLPQAGALPTQAPPSHAQQGAYAYSQHLGGQPPPGVNPYGAYGAHPMGHATAAAAAAAALQPHALMHSMDELGQDSAAAAAAVAAGGHVPGGAVQMSVQPQQHAAHAALAGAPPVEQPSSASPPLALQPAAADVAVATATMQHDFGGAPAQSSVTADAQAAAGAPPGVGSDQQFWHLHDKTLPAPPAQQPPAPPASHTSYMQTEAFRDATSQGGTVQTPVPSGAARAPGQQRSGQRDWDVPPHPGHPVPSAGSGPSAVWNSFDDAAAKGMVDGLVGEDGTAPLLWAATQATSHEAHQQR